jgi:oligopeptide transport system substrate-binding protein
MSKSLVRILSLSLMALLLVAAVGGVFAQDDTKTLVSGLQMVGGDPESLDPGLAETSQSIEILNQIFIGLTTQNVITAETELGIATGFEVEETEDGAVYTFTLRDDIPWVRYNADSGEVEQVTDESGAVRMVTAQDVVYGMTRALDPVTASPYSYVLLPYIIGASEFNAGEADASALMVTAPDATTVQITAPEATAFTPAIYGLWMARPVPQWAIEEGGDSWTEPEFINTNGPFALAEWNHNENVRLVKNPFWPGTDAIPQPALDEVILRFLDPQAQFAEYLAGTMDSIDVPLEEIERVRADEVLSQEYATGNNPCTYYLGFDNQEAPTDNVHLRRALSLAIDRVAIVENVTRGGQIPAQWFTRPGLNAAPTPETHPDLGITYDPEQAQAELALALEEIGELPPLTLSYNDSSNHGAIMQAIQQMWSDTLGIQVELVPMDPSTYFGTVSEEAPMIWRSGWCQDYSDANNFAYDVFFSQSSQNDPGFFNDEFDALVEQARTSDDPEERLELYAQAEEILSDEQAGVAPIYWYTENELHKPYVERAVSITGSQAYYLWDINR